MKKLFAILILMALAVPAFAQFVAGPRVQAPMTIPTGGYILPSAIINATGTNIASPVAFRINGRSPVYWYLDWGCTNATTGVSNTVFNFQYSMDGSKWVGPDNTGLNAFSAGTTHSFTLIQPAAGDQFCTNLTGTVDPSSWNWIRLYSVSNVNIGAATNTIYITNAYFIQGYQ